MTDIAQSSHHVTITLNDVVYGFLTRNYKEQDITAYSVKMASGDMRYTDQTIYQTLVQEDWSHGFGFRDMIDPKGYAYSEDGIDTRFDDKVTIMTALTDASPTAVTVENPGFETAGAGGADVFASWTETAGDGAIADEGTLVNAGSHACKLTAGTTANTKVHQASITVIAGVRYTPKFHTRGDGTYAGQYGIYDVTNGADIVAIKTTGVTGTSFTLVSQSLTAPAGCTEIRIDLWCPSTNGGAAYYDTVSINTEPTTTVKKFIEFQDEVYACTAAGVFKWNGTTWISTGQDTGVALDAISDANYLYVTMDGAPIKRYDGADWADCDQSTGDEAATDMQFLTFAGSGFLWTTDDAMPFAHYGVHEGGVSSPYTFEGGDPDAGGDPAAAYIGAGNIPITGMLSWQNALYVGREDGLWYIPSAGWSSGDTPPAYRALEYYEERHSRNFQTMIVWQSRMYFSLRNDLWRLTGSTIDNVTPPEYKYEYPYWKYGNFRYLTPVGQFLYVVADEDDGATGTGFGDLPFGEGPFGGMAGTGFGDLPFGEGPFGGQTVPSSLLAYDSAAWHKLLELASRPDVVAAMNFTPMNNRLWISIDKASGADEIYYIKHRSGSNMPYASYETTTSPPDGGDNPHYLYTSQFDAGLATVYKHYSALTLEGQFNANKPIDAYYSLDGGGWLHLGTFDDGSGLETITFPTTEALCWGKKIAFRLNLQTASGSTTPVLQRVILQYLPRPTTIYSYDFDVLVADNIKTLDHKIDARSAKDLYDALIDARATHIPFTFYDRWNTSHSVYCTAFNWLPTRMESGNPNTPKELEGRAHVTLVVATNENV